MHNAFSRNLDLLILIADNPTATLRSFASDWPNQMLYLPELSMLPSRHDARLADLLVVADPLPPCFARELEAQRVSWQEPSRNLLEMLNRG